MLFGSGDVRRRRPERLRLRSARSLHHKEVLFDQDHFLTLGDLAGGDGLDTGKVIGIGDDHRGGQLIAGGRNGSHIELEQQLAFLDLVAHLDLGLVALALQLDGIHAHMDQDFQAIVAHDAHGVAGLGNLFDGAVKRSDHFALGRLDGAALAQRLAGENRIVALAEDADLAFQRSADDPIPGGGGGRRRRLVFAVQVGM